MDERAIGKAVLRRHKSTKREVLSGKGLLRVGKHKRRVRGRKHRVSIVEECEGQTTSRTRSFPE